MKDEDYEPIYDDSEDDYEPLYDDLDEEELDDSDEQPYMDGLSNEGSYEEMQSIPDKIDSVKNTIQNVKDQKQKIQDYFRNRNNDQNTKQRLNARNANTQAKKVETDQATREVAKNATKEATKEGAKEATKEVAKKGAEKVAEKGAEKAVQSAGTAIVSGLEGLLTNPYFWIVVAIILIIVMIPLFIAAYGEGDSNDNIIGEITYIEGYESCKSITVIGSGTYDLEDYVAGVVHAEYGSAPFETKKALAVAARTYAINATSNCTFAIDNSSKKQNFSPNFTDDDKLAVTETSGQVLTYDGKIFASEYDSWNCKGSSTCTYTKEPVKTQHTVTLSDKYLKHAAGGHGRGMSQLAAADMADNGSTYDDILKFFYSDGVQISTISQGTSSKSNTLGEFVNGFQIRTSKPNYLNQPDSNYYKYIGSNTFQCPWYAKARAIEIVSTMNNAIESKKRDAIEKITSATGHGSQWYNNAQGSGSMSMFASSNDVNQPRPGAMISWKWNNAGCLAYKSEPGTCMEFGGKNTNYGHVGIIESVNEEKKTVVVSDGWYNCSNWNNTSCMGFGSKEVSYDYLKTYGGNYIFLGYVYIADYVSGGN